MKIQTRQVKELCLNEVEAQIFLNAIRYIKHRLLFHQSKGARSVATLETCERLLRELATLN
jgi:hypothetical protein